MPAFADGSGLGRAEAAKRKNVDRADEPARSASLVQTCLAGAFISQATQQSETSLVLEIGCNDLRALSREDHGRTSPNAVGGAGHKRNLPFDPPVHALRSPFTPPPLPDLASLLLRGRIGASA